MITAILILAGIALVVGLGLTLVNKTLPQKDQSPLDELEALLPATQCAQCGYPGCRPYAEAILAGTADINRCAPGGDATVTAIARLLGRHTSPVNPAYGDYQPGRVAVVDETACIGCALCIAACPVDAIVGAHRYTHTVIRDECTGCKLCLPPCPVDCISIVPLRSANRQAA